MNSLSALEVLFVGNSFTFGNSKYNAAAITDYHENGYGGLPAAFKKMADESGHKDINVTIKAIGGQTLSHHYETAPELFRQHWDVIVLQDHSKRAFKSSMGGNVPALREAVKGISEIAKETNPNVRVLLFETWAHPKRVPEAYPSLTTMQDDIRAAYSGAAEDFGLAGWVPVGDAYMKAIETGIAYDPDQGEKEGAINLYVKDNLHQSKYGCYLNAVMFYAKILNDDPRELPTGKGSSAAGLRVEPENAKALQLIAYSLISGEALPEGFGKPNLQ